MPARLLVIGLDAVEAPLLERLCDEGRDVPVPADVDGRVVDAIVGTHAGER